MKQYLSATAIGDFARCPAFYDFSRMQKLEPLKEQIALIFGDHIHQGFRMLYDSKDVEKAVEKFIELFTPYEGHDEKGMRTLKKGEETIRAYHEQFFGTEAWTDAGGDDRLMSIDLTPEIVWYFKIDRQGVSGEVDAVQEFKTSGYPDQFITEPNLQVQGYLYAYSQLTGRSVKKAVVTVAGLYKSSVKGMVKGTRKDDPWRSVFGRDYIFYEDWQFEQFKQAVVGWAMLIRACKESGNWPLAAPGACGAFGGCPYRILCAAAPEQQQYIKEGSFKRKEGRG